MVPRENAKELKLNDPRKIFVFTVFTALTGITPIDYYESGSTITFLIDKSELRKFRAVALDVIRNISAELKKQVEVVVFSENLEKFIQNLFRPAKVENVIKREIKNKKTALLVKVPVWDRGKALGKNSYKLYRARYFLSKYFDIEHVRIV